jgi:hypothetical protein
MCAETASIIHRKSDENVGPAVDPCDMLGGGTVCLELAIFVLF